MLTLPGFVNAHSHGFQRAMRGLTEGGDFWSWREAMLHEAEGLTPETVRTGYAATYREMLAAGYTAVGEFHYVGVAEGRAAIEAARDVGITLVLLHVAYARAGLPRFRQDTVADYLRQVDAFRATGVTVGIAPHSVRACPPDWLRELGRHAEGEGLVLHVHACEQPKEVEDCIAEYARRPIELLADAGCLGPRTTVVHATHASDAELDLLAQAGARVCVCPTTEANLGDGFVPVERLLERGIPVAIGSDSNVRIDPLEELREIEGIARRQTLRRNVIPPERLLEMGSKEGAAALGIGEWAPAEVDLAHPSLRGVAPEHIQAALVFGCGSDVFAATVDRKAAVR